MDYSNSEAERQEQFDLRQIHSAKSRLNAKPIRTILRKLVAERGYAAEQTHRMNQEEWLKAAGPELGRMSRPGKISRGTLYVEVSDNGTLQELYFRKPAILKSLQTAFPEAKIKKLMFRVVTG